MTIEMKNTNCYEVHVKKDEKSAGITVRLIDYPVTYYFKRYDYLGGSRWCISKTACDWLPLQDRLEILRISEALFTVAIN